MILSLEESPDLDSTSLESLADFATWLRWARHVAIRPGRLKDVMHELLMCAALPQLPPHSLDYWSVEDAVCAPDAPAKQ